jgi:predicted nucleotidyltransferase
MIELTDKQAALVRSILRQYFPSGEARVFGSRYNGGAKKFSDLDLALKSDRLLTIDELGLIGEAFENSSLPFRVDVIDYLSVGENFRVIIDENSGLFYSSETTANEGIPEAGTEGGSCDY